MSLVLTPFASSSAGCCYSLSGGGATAPLLLDAGLTYPDLVRVTKFTLPRYAGFLITHAHGDHARAAKDLWIHGRPIMSAECAKALKLDYTKAQAVEPERQILVGDWTVKPFEVQHDEPGTFGYLIGAPDGSQAVYLTDTSYSRYTFPGITHWFVECNHVEEILRRNAVRGNLDPQRFERTTRTHMSLERLVAMLKANDLTTAKQIWLLHLSDGNSDESLMKKTVMETTGVPTFVAPRRTV